MKHSEVEQLIEILKDQGIQFAPGLSDEEINGIQNLFNIKFPPDLRLVLQLALPISDKFIDWRHCLESDNYKKKIISVIGWPLDGILYDVENNEFWLKGWGDKPESFAEKREIVTQQFVKYPQLIPIYSHRYISSEPLEVENPIFSVYQTDVIYYGFNIFDYFAKEFCFQLPANLSTPAEPLREILFWSELATS